MASNKIRNLFDVTKRELKIQVRSPTYIKRRHLGTKHKKTRLRNHLYPDSAQLRRPFWGRQGFNLVTRNQIIFWPNKRKTNRLDNELTIELKKTQDSVRDGGYVDVRVLVPPLRSRYLRECVSNCVRTQAIMNYETRHYVSFDTQNRRSQSETERNFFEVRLWTTAC